jgi:predicted nucleotidyltransferase
MISTEERVVEHYNESLQYFPENKIIGIFLQGSQNYGLETKESDVDTKLIVAPSFKEFAFNLQPMSTTHVRKNNEHIDFKDVRLMFKTLKKQNLNFLEILFTDYCVIKLPIIIHMRQCVVCRVTQKKNIKKWGAVFKIVKKYLINMDMILNNFNI